MQKQYWVIGAEYHCVEFREAIPGTERVLGPYESFEEANRVWRERSLASRSSATTRYSIVSNAANPARQQHAA